MPIKFLLVCMLATPHSLKSEHLNVASTIKLDFLGMYFLVKNRTIRATHLTCDVTSD